MPWTYVINDLKGEEIVGTFYQKELQKTNQKEFRVEKVIKRKGDKLCVKWKGHDSSFNSWIDKKDVVQMSEYFPEPKTLGGKVKVELYLSNYATKADLEQMQQELIHQNLLKKTDLANLKSDVDKLNIDELKNVPSNLNDLKSKVDELDVDEVVPVPVDLSKLSNVAKNHVVKKSE